MSDTLRRLNPFRNTGTALPPLVLAGAKLLVVYLFFYDLNGPGVDPFLPLLPWLDHPVLGGAFGTALDVSYYLAVLALLFNATPRAGAFWIGLTTLWMVVVDRTLFSNSTCFAGFLLVLSGLYTPGWGPLLLRAQVVLVYAGAALNKVLDPDWQSGRFIAGWLREDHAGHWFTRLAEAWPALLLGWLVIAVEALLALGFAVPLWHRRAIFLGIFFHGGMLLFTGGDLSVRFGYLMAVAYLMLSADKDIGGNTPNEASRPLDRTASMAAR